MTVAGTKDDRGYDAAEALAQWLTTMKKGGGSGSGRGLAMERIKMSLAATKGPTPMRATIVEQVEPV